MIDHLVILVFLYGLIGLLVNFMPYWSTNTALHHCKHWNNSNIVTSKEIYDLLLCQHFVCCISLHDWSLLEFNHYSHLLSLCICPSLLILRDRRCLTWASTQTLILLMVAICMLRACLFGIALLVFKLCQVQRLPYKVQFCVQDITLTLKVWARVLQKFIMNTPVILNLHDC